jgi:hypothetical protein
MTREIPVVTERTQLRMRLEPVEDGGAPFGYREPHLMS